MKHAHIKYKIVWVPDDHKIVENCDIAFCGNKIYVRKTMLTDKNLLDKICHTVALLVSKDGPALLASNSAPVGLLGPGVHIVKR